MIIAGSGSPNSLGYETMGSAYDVAINKAGELYPDIFRSFAVTRHFTSGKFSCADATGETIVALGELFAQSTGNFSSGGQLGEREFRVVLSPEDDITVITSLATLGLLDDKRRFPTVLPFGGISYNNLGLAIIAVVRRYGWSTFNLVCDTASGIGVEVACGIVRQTVLAARNVNAVSIPLDSNTDAAIETALQSCSTRSSVTVLATIFPELYVTILMTDSLQQILPFAFSLTFGNINWTAVSGEVTQIAERSRSNYNLTIPSNMQRNIAQLGTFESALILTQTVLQLNSETKSLSTPMTQGSSIRWFGVTFPPSDKPNSDRRSNERETVTAVIATVIVAAIILLLTSFSIWRTSKTKYYNQTWILDSERLGWIPLETQICQEHHQQLLQGIRSAFDIPTALRLCCLSLFLKKTAAPLEAPGKFVPQILAIVKPDLKPEQAAVLEQARDMMQDGGQSPDDIRAVILKLADLA
ncbi:hypothetical protein BV898_05362 [Hypsibius exemplaris]|uniref:E3 UFM1-protein ligase-like C-terminal domain-containing protein n=1 Tax=Hypsibius exemplaris TaxID=2072580 RepID=A0A1W0X033_HYPEX|nr:hypothetical protein BV898_05362 [Hypsibius exemplaris]